MGTTWAMHRAKGKSKIQPAAVGEVTGEAWPAWCEYLKHRRSPKPLACVIDAGTNVLSWPLDDAWHGSDSEKLVQQLERVANGGRQSDRYLVRRLEQWLEGDPRDPSRAAAMEAIGWAHALPGLSNGLPAAAWHHLLDRLRQLASDAAGLDVATLPLEHQLLAGELPLTLAYQLPEIESCRRLAAEAGPALSRSVVELLDGEGMPAARYLACARPLLACWTRSAYLGHAGKTKVFDDDAWLQLEWLVQQLLRLVREDGSQLFVDGVSGAWCPSLVAAALNLLGGGDERRLASVILPSTAGSTSKHKKSLPSPSVHSEWARVAVLRRDWKPETDVWGLCYHADCVQAELNLRGQRVLSGAMTSTLKANQRPVAVCGDWEEVCWQSDKDVDYLELQLDLPDGRSIQRQMLLAREDRFLFVADAILGEEVAEIEYALELPLAPNCRFQPADETREGFLIGTRRLGVVLPLALPEWRSAHAPGKLEAAPGVLRLVQTARAARLFVPLFIDLDPKRIKKQLTWRRLTVTQQFQILTPDVAVGFRVQVGRAQWLIYRGLKRGNRSVLGQNFTSEFVVSRFARDGQAERLLEIE